MIRIPCSKRRKALCLIDVQPAFIEQSNNLVIQKIANLIRAVPYDSYVESLFWCDDKTLWAKQSKDIMVLRDAEFKTIPEIAELLKFKDIIRVEKQTKSVFKGDVPIEAILKKMNIEEIHFVGFDTDDCILVSAEEAFDLGFFSYVIEECTASNSGLSMKEHALAVLRNVSLTNNSCVEDIEFCQLE